jgi:zinc transporter ZupT
LDGSFLCKREDRKDFAKASSSLRRWQTVDESMTAILLSLATFFSTLAGGLFALRFRHRLHYILSFTAGVLLGVVSFDILPEVFELAKRRGFDATAAMIALVVGFLLFHSLEKFLLMHRGHEDRYAPHHHPKVGVASALALVAHSFMDGVGIGLAFQVSPTAGIAVAIAVITHDFSDGLNTVSLMLVHRNSELRSFVMLVLDALAPVLGAASTLLFQVPSFVLMIYLGFFAGFLLYIAASDVLPEAHSGATSAVAAGLIALTCLGTAFIFVTMQVMRGG